MPRSSRFVAILAISAAALALPAVAHGADGYVVKRGDSLSVIATRHGVRLSDLLRVNGLTLTSVIHPGQRLAIPGATSGGSAAASGGSTYTIKAGDTLIGIASRHGVRLGALLGANGLTVSSVIQPGQRLTIPGAATAPASTGGSPAAAGGPTYTVRAGDSLGAIASRHNVTLAALLGANGLTATSVIHPGRQLTLPAGATVSATDRVLAFALAQVGKPYKFFTAGPQTFDCSGLVVAAYAQIGVRLVHHSGSQARQGTAVDFWNEPVRAGDLVFMATNGSTVINHVGIALSATTWVQAQQSVGTVRVTPMPPDSMIVAVRRVV